MVSFLLRRPFVKLLEIFFISNATVTCQAEIRMLCAKAEICLSMCPRCLCNRHLLHRQSGHFVNSSHLLSLIKKMFPTLVTRSVSHQSPFRGSCVPHDCDIWCFQCFSWTWPCGRSPGLVHRHTNGGAERLMVGSNSPCFTYPPKSGI